MKPIFISLFLFISYTTTISDAERMGFKGKVKAVLETTFYSSSEYSFQDRYSFDNQGNLLQKLNYNTEIGFDKKMNLIPGDTTFFEKKKGITYFHTNVKDRLKSKGSIEEINPQLIKTTFEEPDFPIYIETLTHFNKNFQKTKMIRKGMFRNDSIHLEMNYFYEKNELILYVVEDKKKQTIDSISVRNFTYDEKGNCLITEYYKNEKLENRITYQYQYY